MILLQRDFTNMVSQIDEIYSLGFRFVKEFPLFHPQEGIGE